MVPARLISEQALQFPQSEAWLLLQKVNYLISMITQNAAYILSTCCTNGLLFEEDYSVFASTGTSFDFSINGIFKSNPLCFAVNCEIDENKRMSLFHRQELVVFNYTSHKPTKI